MGTHRLATQRTRVIMKFFVLLSVTVAAASAQYPVAYAAGLGYAPHAAYGAYGVAPAAAVAPIAPEVTSSQYRAEDEAGNTAYGYQNINNAAIFLDEALEASYDVDRSLRWMSSTKATKSAAAG